MLNPGLFPWGPRITLCLETQCPQEAAALPMGSGMGCEKLDAGEAWEEGELE